MNESTTISLDGDAERYSEYFPGLGVAVLVIAAKAHTALTFRSIFAYELHI